MFVACGICCLAKHHIPQATNIPYQPSLIKPVTKIPYGFLTAASPLFYTLYITDITNLVKICAKQTNIICIVQKKIIIVCEGIRWGLTVLHLLK